MERGEGVRRKDPPSDAMAETPSEIPCKGGRWTTGHILPVGTPVPEIPDPAKYFGTIVLHKPIFLAALAALYLTLIPRKQ